MHASLTHRQHARSMAATRRQHGITMDLLTLSIAVATATTCTIILNALFARRIKQTLNVSLNEWAARKTAAAEKHTKELAARLSQEMESVETTLAALRSERMRAVATFRKSSKKPAFMDDDDQADDQDDSGVTAWLGKMAENPIVRAMARKNDVDLDALISGDDGEWDRVDQLLHGKKPSKRTAGDQDAAGDQDRKTAPPAPPADPPKSFL